MDSNKIKKQNKKTATNSKEQTNNIRQSRVDTRIPIQLLVDYSCNGHFLFDFCKDLGTGGIFIQTDTPLAQGSELTLTFTIPDSKETLQTVGKVIWVQEKVPGKKDLVPGMGVQFRNFGAKQRHILEEFVKRYHGEKYLHQENTDINPKKTA